MCNIHIIYLFLKFILIDDQKITKTYLVYCPNNCGHSYTGIQCKKNLKRHLKFECGVEPQFHCSLCLKPFRHKSSLKSHAILVHKSFI